MARPSLLFTQMEPKVTEKLNEQIEELNSRAQQILENAEKGDQTIADAKAIIDDEIKPQLDLLIKDRNEQVKLDEFKALQSQIGDLNSVIEELRKPSGNFKVQPESGATAASDNPYAELGPNDKPVYNQLADIVKANKGSSEARERLQTAGKAVADAHGGWSFGHEGKAMTEGTENQGGYLVQPLLERQLVLKREKDNILRGLCSSLNVTTNAVQLDQLTLSTLAGWVKELEAKPEETEMTTGTVTASIFTVAGLAKVSNQLLADSNPAIDQLVTTDLAKRIVAIEESAFLYGTGTNQPRGILETSEVATIENNNEEDPSKAGGLLDAILEAIAEVQFRWGQPSAIAMHPRTWTSILKSRDSVGHYTISPRNIFGAGYDPETPRTYIEGPAQTLFGVEVALSNRIPTNKGAGTNESRVIVGDFQEALIFDRQGITIDESPHVYFTTNATVFRAEARVGFTAARAPKAFCVIGGKALANR